MVLFTSYTLFTTAALSQSKYMCTSGLASVAAAMSKLF